MILCIFKYIHIYTYLAGSHANESNIVKLKFSLLNKQAQISCSSSIHELKNLTY